MCLWAVCCDFERGWRWTEESVCGFLAHWGFACLFAEANGDSKFGR